MARRRELKNIASGLLCSFISRNNDVGGYWGIGKLCLLAQDSATTGVEIDLLSKTVLPESTEFSKLLQGYNSFLQRHLAARNIPDCWIASAIVELDFNPKEQPEKQVPIITWGKLFKLSVTILDDRSRKHTVSTYSYCAPHNSRKEHQSVGLRY
ncbi:hypothetical protein ACN9MZ_23105 [Pseudoduganella sp. S-14]|jgi:hypothetical protein|uniref:hypothetical protein n=1 Tax=Pseudoduganella sp. S-14 TaxID=3404065 RepID=UPI003CE689A8